MSKRISNRSRRSTQGFTLKEVVLVIAALTFMGITLTIATLVIRALWAVGS